MGGLWNIAMMDLGLRTEGHVFIEDEFSYNCLQQKLKFVKKEKDKDNHCLVKELCIASNILGSHGKPRRHGYIAT